MCHLRIGLCAALSMLALAPVARAEAKLVIPHMGFLLDGADVPVEGLVDLKVQLWRHQSGVDPLEKPLWADTFIGTHVVRGRYAVVLGDTNVPGHTTSGLGGDLFADAAYLSVTIGQIELLPRLPVGVVPSALRAAQADRAASADVAKALNCTGCVTNDLIANGTIAGAKLAAGLDGALLADGSVRTEKLAGGLDGALLANGSVRPEKLASGVDGALLLDASVSGAKLQDASVPTGKLSGSLNGGTLLDGSVTDAKLGTGLNGARLLENSLPPDRIKGSIPASRIAAGPGSGLDADSLDGKDATAFVQLGSSGDVSLTGSVTATAFNGSGAGLTGIPDGALPSSLVRLGANNAFTGKNTFAPPLGIGIPSPTLPLEVAGAIRIGTSTTACTTAIEGAIRYSASAKNIEFCDGAAWKLVGAGAPNSQQNPAISCKDVLQKGQSIGSGIYWLDPNGGSNADAFQATCDMTTDGGGWTILASFTGSDGEQPLVSNTEIQGNPLTYAHSNLNVAKKIALSGLATESLFRRSSGQWLKANAPIFDATLATASSHVHRAITLTANDGTSVAAYMGWSNYNYAGGGDFGISMNPDGATCNGSTVQGFDHHSSGYAHLNCSCMRQYLYNYSGVVADGDAAYKVNTGLGSWGATASCDGNEGGGIAWYAAVR